MIFCATDAWYILCTNKIYTYVLKKPYFIFPHYVFQARRALGDFGILIALVAMVLLDYFLEHTYTQVTSLVIWIPVFFF